jgi:hypothetical protein
MTISALRHSNEDSHHVLGCIVDHWVKKIQKILNIYEWARFCSYGVRLVIVTSFWLADKASNQTELKGRVQTHPIVISLQTK